MPSSPDAVPVIELDDIDSTNLEAMRQVSSGQRGPLWIRAGRQSAGRGRSGRLWASQPGNLQATLILSPGCEPERLPELSLLTGVAVLDAVQPLLAQATIGERRALRLKWPNDVLAGEAKLAGILIESTMTGGECIAAVGIGVNVACAPQIEGRATAALADWGATTTPRELLVEIDARMRQWLGVWQRGADFALVRAAWLERAHAPGTPITINTGSETLHGVFAGIDETGALLVDSVRGQQNGLRRFTFGDVSLMPR